MPFGDVYRELGRLLRDFREKAKPKVSQARLAEQVGLSRTSITNIEKGRQRIPFDLLFSLADALNVDPRNLIPNRSSSPPPDLEEKLARVPDEAGREAVKRLVSSR